MFSLVEAFLLLSYRTQGWLSFCMYTGMVYVLSCRGFLDVIRDGVHLMLSYTGMLYVLSCSGFLDVIVHSDGVCSIL